jgi:methylated-DNA-[protein]-cysteine S-methyltransferase
VPPGRVTTYGDLAKLLGTSPRVVGRLLSLNDEAPVVPCHRVVGRDGSLVGYSGPGGVEFKKMLLKLEGVEFDRRGRVSRKHFLSLWKMLVEG